jgi:CBS domain-containing protein
MGNGTSKQIKHSEGKFMTVRDVMTEEVMCAAPDTTLEEIATMMKTVDTGAIPVTEEDELIGIITDRDIVMRCVAEGHDASEMTAEEVVGEEVETIDPEADIEEARELMARKQIRRLPVVDKGELVGMLSIGDIAVKQGNEEQTGETLKEVSRGVKNARRTQAHPARKSEMSKRSAHKDVAHKNKEAGVHQGISNRNLNEEVQRQGRVVSIRPEANELPRGQKKSSGRKAS